MPPCSPAHSRHNGLLADPNPTHYSKGHVDTHTKNVMFSAESIEWGTPAAIYEIRNRRYHFELDVCASSSNFKHPNYITQEQDSFTMPWVVRMEDGDPGDCLPWRPARCWMNPPYCRQERVCNPATCRLKRCAKRGFHTESYVPGLYQWVDLAYRRSLDGSLVDCLLPGKTGSRWWRDYVWDNDQHCVRDHVELTCLPGRLTFEGATDSAPFDSVLVTFLPQ